MAWDILSTCALACIKISAIFFYRRIFCVSGNKTYFSIATLATAIIVSLWLVTFLLLTGFQCGSHFSALWNGSYVKYCTVSFPFLYGLVISDFLLDVWILALPVPPVSPLDALCFYDTHVEASIFRFASSTPRVGEDLQSWEFSCWHLCRYPSRNALMYHAHSPQRFGSIYCSNDHLHADPDRWGKSLPFLLSVLTRSPAGPEALIKYDEGINLSLRPPKRLTHSILVTITKALYFSMLEAGMSLVAVNLPCLSFLISKQALRISMYSLRSIFSLQSSASSNRPTAGNDASQGVSKGDVKDSFSTSSRSNLARHTNREAYERFEMHDQGAFDAEKGV